MNKKAALNEAIKKGGGMAAFTASIGAPSIYAVKQWRISGVPAAYCPTIERVTGVTCERLCPKVEWSAIRNNQPEAA